MNTEKIKVGDAFRCVSDLTTFKLISIQTHEVSNGRKIKLSDELFTFQYTNSTKTFTNRTQDIKRAFMFKFWVKIK